MPEDGNVSRRAVLTRLAVGTTIASGLTDGGVADDGSEREGDAGKQTRFGAGFAAQSAGGLYGGEYVLDRRDEYVQVMPINVILRTDRSLEEIRRVLRSAGWTTVDGNSLSGAPKYARNAAGEPIRAELDVADDTWNFDARDQRTHASLWTFHEGDDDLRNVSIAAHVDVGTLIEMKYDVKFSELVGDPASAVSPGHRGERFDAARERLVEVFIADGWEEVGRVEYANDHGSGDGSEGYWRDHDGFAAVLEPAEGTDAAGGSDDAADEGGFPYEIRTGSATPDGKQVTFEGSVTAPSGEVTVGFAWQDDNAMWGETDSQTFAPDGTREFSITGEVPRNAFDYPYYAWAVFHDHGEARYRGDIREVRVPDYSGTVAVETLGVDAGTDSATIRGRVTDFGQASEIPVGGEVTEDGGIWHGASRETKTPGDDPAFAVEVGDLEPGTEYRGRAFGQVSSGAGSAKVTGEAVSFTTDGGEEGDESGEIAVETGDASPDPETPRFVTFTGRIEGLSEGSTAEVGFEYQDYNAMWGETATEEISGGETAGGEATEFTITEQMPYVGREFPYRAVATVRDSSGTERHVGETRQVSVPNFVDTIAVETVDVTASGTTATVRGRIADFGQATEVLANAEVWRPGSNSRTSRTERVSLSADGSPEFEVTIPGLDPDAEYRARTMAEIPAGPTYATTYGNEVTFTTGDGDSGTDESTTTTQSDSEAEGETGADSGTTTTEEEPTPKTTEEADAAGAAAEEPTTTTTEAEREPTTTTTTTTEEP